ncbi:finger 239-like [Podarcis lilfordi]|uniref:Finger 239-like n=1 Tax=Podarcis lilfordi TaxID=74358 RepID=A0AA35JZK9_9SAUR|nr:finger 239-like [Podarcis lilfordi]
MKKSAPSPDPNPKAPLILQDHPKWKEKGKCVMSKKTFRDDLNGHHQTHQEEKPHNGTECRKSFSDNGDLGPHQRTHTDRHRGGRRGGGGSGDGKVTSSPFLGKLGGVWLTREASAAEGASCCDGSRSLLWSRSQSAEQSGRLSSVRPEQQERGIN